MVVTIIVGIVCAGLFYLVGPGGIVIAGILLAMAGFKAIGGNDDD